MKCGFDAPTQMNQPLSNEQTELKESALGRRIRKRYNQPTNNKSGFVSENEKKDSTQAEEIQNFSKKLNEIRSTKTTISNEIVEADENNDKNIFILVFFAFINLFKKTIRALIPSSKEKVRRNSIIIFLIFVSMICIGYIIDIVKKSKVINE